MKDVVYFVLSNDFEGDIIITDKYFTDEDNAKLCAEYRTLCEPFVANYEVVELERGDGVDYAKLIEQFKAEKSERITSRAIEKLRHLKQMF